MLTHNTHYATYRVKFGVLVEDRQFYFSRLIRVPLFCYQLCNRTSVQRQYYSSRNRLLEDVRCFVAAFIEDEYKTVSDFEFRDYSFRASERFTDFLTGFLFSGFYDFDFSRFDGLSWGCCYGFVKFSVYRLGE